MLVPVGGNRCCENRKHKIQSPVLPSVTEETEFYVRSVCCETGLLMHSKDQSPSLREDGFTFAL